MEQPIQTYTRLEFAERQLDRAIELFLQGDHVSALTLAGAAEDIFGGTLRLQGKTPIYDQHFSVYREIHTLIWHTLYENKDYNRERNGARNAAKHIDGAHDATYTCDLEKEAVDMIVRASANRDYLDLPRTDAIYQFNNWFWEHWVGI